ncbi:MAG: phosphatidate cytidylyltransferase [Candidatus Diapherotrites archaeon]|nr:phosphatidate cytidylyltransferase [Candidatus Diapherotrites archaeon]
MNKEFSRQLMHLAFGIFFIAEILLFGIAASLMTAIALLVFGVILSLLISEGISIPLLHKAVKHVERESEQSMPGKAALVFVLAVIVTIIVFVLQGRAIVLGALIVLVFGDSFSAIVGKKFGKTKIFGKRTLEGTIAGIIAASIPLAFLFHPVLAFLAALAGMLAEYLPFDDNFTVPLAAGLVLIIL